MRPFVFLSCLFLIIGSLAAEESFPTGLAARLVIGQPTFTAQEEGASATLLGAVGGVAYANDMLVVADSNRIGATPVNHRVLIYKNLSQMLPEPTDAIPQDELEDQGFCPVSVGEATVVLGQTEFEVDPEDALQTPAADTLRRPLGVATDGVRLAAADTDNNRVLIWNTIPVYNAQPADVVLGQPNFETALANFPTSPTSQSLRGPQGVWIQDERLFVADTGNNRVLIWDPIPTSNHAPANFVLGRESFVDFVPPDLLEADFDPQADSMLNPVSVTSDGQRLYVTDLGYNRVLIWNSIPDRNTQPADIVVGQPGMTSGVANYTSELCESTGQDDDGDDIYPGRCAATLSFPRFALSDGEKLFIADGGNDRILVYDHLPLEDGTAADHVIGQVSDTENHVSDDEYLNEIASAGVVRTPLSLAFDGENLYAADPFNRRVMVFTEAEDLLANTGVRNAASIEGYANSIVLFAGGTNEGEEVSLIIQGEREYVYEMREDDTVGDVILGLAAEVNEGDGDPDILAVPNSSLLALILVSRVSGSAGNSIAFTFSLSEGAVDIAISAEGSTLEEGGEATRIAPGTIVSVFGENLAEGEFVVPGGPEDLPTEYGGVQVYFDGVRAPLFYVSPTQINAQMPVEFSDREGVNAWVRTERSDGSVTASNVIPVPMIYANPGVFGYYSGEEPRQAVAVHSSSYATGVVSVDGGAREGDTAAIIIGPEDNEREYKYTVQESDVDYEDEDGNITDPYYGAGNIRRALIELVNQDPEVEASPSGQFNRIILRAREPGPEFEGIPYSVHTKDDTFVVLTATTDELCCASQAGTLVTEANPAVPGEIISIYATGLGLVDPEEASEAQQTGKPYTGPELNNATRTSVFLADLTAHVLFNGLEQGGVGLYRIDFQLNPTLPTDLLSVGAVYQDYQLSNRFTVPVVEPEDQDSEE